MECVFDRRIVSLRHCFAESVRNPTVRNDCDQQNAVALAIGKKDSDASRFAQALTGGPRGAATNRKAAIRVRDGEPPHDRSIVSTPGGTSSFHATPQDALIV